MMTNNGGFMSNLELNADIIDMRDILERFEELETELLAVYDDQQENEADGEPAEGGEDGDFLAWLSDCALEEAEKYRELKAIIDELKGCGGDEQWRGDWYPITLIKDSYFTDYCMELVQDIGDLPRDIPSYLEIDWEKTADNIRMDYSETEIDGETYYFR